MNRLAFWISALLLVILLIFGSRWYYNHHCGPDATLSSSSTSITQPGLNSFFVADGDFKLEDNATFAFPPSGSQMTLPEELEPSFRSFVTYLNQHPERQLTLTGLYSGEERNKSDFSDLGLARADAMRNKLFAFGADKKNILINSRRNDNLDMGKGTLFGGVEFAFADRSPASSSPAPSTSQPASSASVTPSGGSSDLVGSLGSSLKANPHTVFFANGTSQPKMDQAFKDFLADLRYYLEKTPGATVQVTGYTDNTGSRETNIRLSKSRATQVRNILVNRGGIPASNIKVAGNGPDSPIADNNTQEGRSKNRRVVITLAP